MNRTATEQLVEAEPTQANEKKEVRERIMILKL